MPYLEIFGYAASIITAISLMMHNIWKLRWYNMIGSGMFAVYATVMHTYPVAIVNAFIVAADIYYIWKLRTDKDMFTLVEAAEADNWLLPAFLKLYGEDIKTYFPNFELTEKTKGKVLFILRNLSPVGLFVFEDEGNGTAGIQLDYVIPSHRDLSNARFFFNESRNKFIDAGYRDFVCRNPAKEHINYLKQIGFAPAGDNNIWVKTLVTGKDIKNKGN